MRKLAAALPINSLTGFQAANAAASISQTGLGTKTSEQASASIAFLTTRWNSFLIVRSSKDRQNQRCVLRGKILLHITR